MYYLDDYSNILFKDKESCVQSIKNGWFENRVARFTHESYNGLSERIVEAVIDDKLTPELTAELKEAFHSYFDDFLAEHLITVEDKDIEEYLDYCDYDWDD